MRFFFYGTLIAGSGNRVARTAHALLRDLGPATLRGRLFAIPDPRGWYPVLLQGSGPVCGRVYGTRAGFAAGDLASLDAYEDYDPANPAASLYRRRKVAVRARGGRAPAQVYRFNRRLPAGARPIPGGEFWAWLAAHRGRAYGEGGRSGSSG